ncbi:MAG: hypothetical protein FWC41_07985 [Firmicutes bacterium]|nr:hypothetical protein [Bacillota bacterium]
MKNDGLSTIFNTDTSSRRVRSCLQYDFLDIEGNNLKHKLMNDKYRNVLYVFV